MDEDKFISEYLDSRVMRRTHDPDTLHNIYAQKYTNWVVPYFNASGLSRVPLLLLCNTLYKLPFTTQIRDKAFFTCDYYLHSFFYDLNYALCVPSASDVMVNVCLTHFIASLYLNNDITKAWALAQTCPDIESYKKDTPYRDNATKTHLVELTDIQEQFTLLHEANHYLYSRNLLSAEWNTSADFEAILKVLPSDETLDVRISSLSEECCCDSQAVKYMMAHFLPQNGIDWQDFLSLLYKVPIYLYILVCIDESAKDKSFPESGYTGTMADLSCRMYFMYYTIQKYAASPEIRAVNSSVYDEHVNLLKDLLNTVRWILAAAIDELTEASSSPMPCSDEEKQEYMKRYLKLL